jgi:hypothetical protein
MKTVVVARTTDVAKAQLFLSLGLHRIEVNEKTCRSGYVVK